MKIRIPEALQELNVLDARLETGDLTLVQIDEIAERAAQIARDILAKPVSVSSGNIQFTVDLSQTVHEAASKIFEKAFVAKQALLDREVSYLPEIVGLDAKLSELFLRESSLDPDSMAEDLVLAVQQLEKLEGHKIGSAHLVEKLQLLKEKIEGLILSFHFPVLRDLGRFGHDLDLIYVGG